MTRADKTQTRYDRILEAGLHVFSQKGYKNSAVDDIAQESQTSKGGVYFHFPNKQAIFLKLLDQMASLLLSRAEAAMAAEPEMTRKGDAALLTVLRTFAGHRTLTRLFLVEALGAGREFNATMMDIHAGFAALITRYFNEMVRAGLVAPLATDLAGMAWFGAVNEVVMRWVLTDQPAKLEDAYPALRDLLRRGIGLESA